MRILNPLYDWAFKYLMDNNEIAKKFLSILLKKNVIHLENAKYLKSLNIEIEIIAKTTGLSESEIEKL